MRMSKLRWRNGLSTHWVLVLSPVLLGLMGLGLDTGWITLTARQLQNAADAAALAGALDIHMDVSASALLAQQTALANSADGKAIALASNASNDPNGDIVLGVYNTSTRTFTPSLSSPNAMKVVARRSSGSSNGSLPLFFGSIFGVLHTDVTRSAVAVSGAMTPFQIKFTTNALGLGSADLNGSAAASPNVAGVFYISSTTGQGSILNVQRSGIAGVGTASDPLLITATTKTHLDTVAVPDNGTNDYHAGVTYLTKENATTPDGTDEGLGVVAFTVDTKTGLRTFKNGVAVLEGSKEISGGTDISTVMHDGPPHVDESAIFAFNPAFPVAARSVVVRLSKFEATDALDLTVHVTGGQTYQFTFIGPTGAGASYFASVSGSTTLRDLNFNLLPGLGATDTIQDITIRAVDNNPASPKGTAEHFLVTRISGNQVHLHPYLVQ